MRTHARTVLAGCVALMTGLAGCTGDGGDGPGPEGSTTGARCPRTMTLALEADRGPIDATFAPHGGGAYVDPNGELHVVFGDRAFELAGPQPDDLVTVSLLIPGEREGPAEREYTSSADGLNLDVSRQDAGDSITSSFGLAGTGDEVRLTITKLGRDYLCADVFASSNPETGRLLHLAGAIEVPYGEFEDL